MSLASKFITEVFINNPTSDLNILKSQVYTFIEENQESLRNYKSYEMEYKNSVLNRVCRKLRIQK